MRGRFCTQPFLVERSACHPNAFLLPLRWVSRSPPHPPQCAHWGTYGLWWLRLDLTEQSPGLFDPRGEGFGGGNAPSRLRNHASQPAQLVGGPLRALENGPQARQKKGRTPAGSPQTRKGGSREEEPLPPWCSFLRLSSKESRAPARGRAGTGRCAPRAASEPPTRRVRSPAPACQAPHQTGALFFAQFCATFLPPPCTPACNFGPGSPGGERRFCHAHPP